MGSQLKIGWPALVSESPAHMAVPDSRDGYTINVKDTKAMPKAQKDYRLFGVLHAIFWGYPPAISVPIIWTVSLATPSYPSQMSWTLVI